MRTHKKRLRKKPKFHIKLYSGITSWQDWEPSDAVVRGKLSGCIIESNRSGETNWVVVQKNNTGWFD